MSEAHTVVTPERLFQFAFGYAPPLMIEACVRHGVFDALDKGPKTLEEVSQETGASKRGLRAVMNALVGLELLRRDLQQRYMLTPESAAFLVKSKPSFLGGFFRHISSQTLPRWAQLAEVMVTGKPASAVNQETEGAAFFADFVGDLFAFNFRAAQKLGEALALLKFATPIRILDIAAGAGVWGIGIAQNSPQAEITAVDWPEVLPITRQFAARFGLAERLHTIKGDISTVDFGTGYNVATLGHILHSEGVERSRALLKKVFDALAPGGVIAIAEMLPNDERTGPPHALIFAVNMLINTEVGDTYSFDEISHWLKEVGFINPRTLEAPAPSPLILATKPAQ